MNQFDTAAAEVVALEATQMPRPPRVTAGSSVVGAILGLGMWTDSTPMGVFGRLVGLRGCEPFGGGGPKAALTVGGRRGVARVDDVELEVGNRVRRRSCVQKGSAG